MSFDNDRPPPERLERTAFERSAEIATIELHRDLSLSQHTDIQSASGIQLSAEIVDGDGEILRLQFLRQDLAYQLVVNQSIISPIRALPCELLSEIFALVLESESSERPGLSDAERDRLRRNERWVHNPPFTCVCTLWRHTALATPALWTAIQIEYGSRMHEKPQLMKEFVGRSSGMPLYVHVREQDRTRWSTREHSTSETLFMLARLSQHRWRSLRLLGRVSLRAPLDLPLLERLDVKGSRELYSNLFRNTPRLRAVAIEWIDLPAEQIPFWPSITDIRLDCAMLDEEEIIAVHRVLYLHRQMLRHLTLPDTVPFLDVDDEDAIPIDPYEMPSLLSLDVGGFTYSILHLISTPTLAHLTVRNASSRNNNAGVFDDVLADGFIATGYLRSLTLVGVEFDTLERICAILEGLPGLERLEISESPLTAPRVEHLVLQDEFLQWLVVDSGKSMHLPNIVALLLVFRDPTLILESTHGLLREIKYSRSMARAVNGVWVKQLKELDTNVQGSSWPAAGYSSFC
ncbi:hypothetical protein BD626DRAFT_126776 [Schizophyllum amplum]|uniref:F-box domain-containing protein n=1 Tax=Schizophyllum amplum TaxID=97359 RepID=A0A550C709_9AGAR|nr:hypothetical protein BD626DRAFT_126776 [Auriculariopsis ampla]